MVAAAAAVVVVVLVALLVLLVQVLVQVLVLVLVLSSAVALAVAVAVAVGADVGSARSPPCLMDPPRHLSKALCNNVVGLVCAGQEDFEVCSKPNQFTAVFWGRSPCA